LKKVSGENWDLLFCHTKVVRVVGLSEGLTTRGKTCRSGVRRIYKRGERKRKKDLRRQRLRTQSVTKPPLPCAPASLIKLRTGLPTGSSLERLTVNRWGSLGSIAAWGAPTGTVEPAFGSGKAPLLHCAVNGRWLGMWIDDLWLQLQTKVSWGQTGLGIRPFAM
jgi:hypothetical protein